MKKVEARAFHDEMSDADRQAARGVSVPAGRAALLIFAIVALAWVSIACTQQQVMEMNLGTGVNQMRADNGLKPLTIDASLSVVARERAEDMAENDYFGHLPPDGCDVRCLYNKEGITSAWVGEVIAWNTFSGGPDRARDPAYVAQQPDPFQRYH